MTTESYASKSVDVFVDDPDDQELLFSVDVSVPVNMVISSAEIIILVNGAFKVPLPYDELSVVVFSSNIIPIEKAGVILDHMFDTDAISSMKLVLPSNIMYAAGLEELKYETLPGLRKYVQNMYVRAADSVPIEVILETVRRKTVKVLVPYPAVTVRELLHLLPSTDPKFALSRANITVFFKNGASENLRDWKDTEALASGSIAGFAISPCTAVIEKPQCHICSTDFYEVTTQGVHKPTKICTQNHVICLPCAQQLIKMAPMCPFCRTRMGIVEVFENKKAFEANKKTLRFDGGRRRPTRRRPTRRRQSKRKRRTSRSQNKKKSTRRGA